MNMTIAHPQSNELPQVKGPEMNDRDYINDVMSFQKYLSNGYNTGLNEAQHPQLHSTVQQMLVDVHHSQNQLFNVMFDKGWYKMKAAEAQEIQQAHQQFTNYKTQFPTF